MISAGSDLTAAQKARCRRLGTIASLLDSTGDLMGAEFCTDALMVYAVALKYHDLATATLEGYRND
jgi:hypothetical protein